VRRAGSCAAIVALAAAAAAAAPAAPAGPGSGVRAAATAVGVAEREFRISLYRTRVRRGTVRLNVRNLGEDTHDLAISGPGGFGPVSTGDIRSGGRATLTVALRRPGRYSLVCSEADHARRGMRATLVVRR
jgi:plastocyanin